VIAATLENPGAPAWSVRELTDGPVGGWEPAIDPAAWSVRRELHMLVQRVVQLDGDDRTGAAAPTPIGLLVWSPSTAARVPRPPSVPPSPPARPPR
jgi:hypothetical protein